MSPSTLLSSRSSTEVVPLWISKLDLLVDHLQQWAEDADWATRRLSKRLHGSDADAPGLLMQHEFVRIQLEPMGELTDGEAVADLYLMPAYDDVARVSSDGDDWLLTYERDEDQSLVGDGRKLTRSVFQQLLQDMKNHAATL